jgi:translation initiation factor 2B subunit (eIF-2B alpha/beta/delta family)
LRPEPPADVWPDPPPNVSVASHLFEQIPLDLIAALVSDVGVLPPDMSI